MVSTKMNQFLKQIRAGGKKFKAASIEQQRIDCDLAFAHLDIPETVNDTQSTLAGCHARRFQPKGCTSTGAVLCSHGAGYRTGSTTSHASLMAYLSLACDAAVVGIDYRLAPEHPFPAGLNDAVAAYQALIESRAPGQIMIAGDSAGGGLALACTLRLKEEGFPLPGCLTLISPGLDHTAALDDEADDSKAVGYAGDYPLETVGISPIFGDMAGLPPILVHVADDEPFAERCSELVERTRAVEVSCDLTAYSEAFHVFHAFTNLPEAQRAIREIGDFFKFQTKSPAR